MVKLNRSLWPEGCRNWALKVGGSSDRADPIGMVQPARAVEPSWLARPRGTAQISSALKSLCDLAEEAVSSSDVSRLLTSARDLGQAVEIYTSASLQW